ncbi:MAG: PEP-CTERM sorting domain-containing protein [Isosphaeraceae bacterium]|nr:PEP-CTERM sorting domain-containing protein [Isosphaeraceae bacterium]
MRFSRLLVFICLASAAIALPKGSAQAGNLVVYDLAGVSAGESLRQNPTFVAPGLSASSLSPGAGLTADGRTFAYAFTDWTRSDSPDTDDYIAFTVTPDAGNSVTFETISLRLFSASNLPPGPRMWELRGSGDGFATSTLLADFASDGNSFTAGPLSLAALGTTASAVEFRLYGYEAGASFAVDGLANDPAFPNPPGVVLTGTVQPAGVVVPEPSSVVLLCAGGLTLLAGRRLRRSA